MRKIKKFLKICMPTFSKKLLSKYGEVTVVKSANPKHRNCEHLLYLSNSSICTNNKAYFSNFIKCYCKLNKTNFQTDLNISCKYYK